MARHDPTFDDVSDREYEYKPSGSVILVGAIFFGACAAVLANAAASNDRGLVVFRIIRLQPGAATVFYWVLCAGSLAFVGWSALLFLRRLLLRQRIVLTKRSVILPESHWSSSETEVTFDEIHAVSTAEVAGQRCLYIYRSNGKKSSIIASYLPSRDAFDELCALTQERHECANQKKAGSKIEG